MERIAFIWGDTFIYWSQILLVLAAVTAAAFYGAFYIKKEGNVFACVVSILLTMVIGIPLSRLVHWYARTPVYESFAAAMTDYSQGGYALIGMFVGAFIAAALLRLLQVSRSLPRMLDCMAVAGSIGIAVGRLASLFNTSDRGMILADEFTFPLTAPVANAVSGMAENRLAIFMIQSALAAAIAVILILYMLWRFVIRKKHPDGDIFLLFLLLYCSCQVVCDSPRYDSLYFRSNGFVSIVQIFGLLALLVPIVLFSIRMVRRTGFKVYHVIPWVIIGGALGLAGYMEYFVQRNGHRALLAYTVMSGAMLMVMLTGLVVRCIGNWHMTRKVSPVTEVIPVAVPELQEIPEAEAEAVEAAEAEAAETEVPEAKAEAPEAE